MTQYDTVWHEFHPFAVHDRTTRLERVELIHLPLPQRQLAAHVAQLVLEEESRAARAHGAVTLVVNGATPYV